MDDWLIDDDRLSIGRKSVLPGEGFFRPDSVEEAQAERETAEALDGASTVVVADPDADGLACVATIREARGDAALVPAGPHELDQAIEWTAEYAEHGATVFVCDLCPDEADDVAALDALLERVDRVAWYDHHQWPDDLEALVREAGVDLAIGDSEEVCSADVTVAELDADLPERFADLAAATRDHDSVTAIVNNDGVVRGRTLTCFTHGFDALDAVVQSVADEFDHPIETTPKLGPHSDHWPYVQWGVPGYHLMAETDYEGRGWGHTRADTLDKLEPRNLREQSILIAELVVRLADEETDVHHRSAEAIADQLEDEDLATGMKIIGDWPYESGTDAN